MRNYALALVGALAARASAECTLDVLMTATNDLFTAQTAGNTQAASFADTIKYMENRKTTDITKGILSQALKIDHNRSQHDVTQCAAFSEFIVTNSAKPYVIATQMRLDNTTYKVSQIDTILTTKGDWLFNVTVSHTQPLSPHC